MQGDQATVYKCFGRMAWTLPKKSFDPSHGINFRVCNRRLYISHAQWRDPLVIEDLNNTIARRAHGHICEGVQIQRVQ